jgi:hypothetical protein
MPYASEAHVVNLEFRQIYKLNGIYVNSNPVAGKI